MGEANVPLGIVKWFDPKKGYGFILPEDGGKDVFVHIKTVQKAGYTGLVEGARIAYDVRLDRSGKMSAESLRIA
jgi:cold shock protein